MAAEWDLGVVEEEYAHRCFAGDPVVAEKLLADLWVVARESSLVEDKLGLHKGP